MVEYRGVVNQDYRDGRISRSIDHQDYREDGRIKRSSLSGQ